MYTAHRSPTNNEQKSKQSSEISPKRAVVIKDRKFDASRFIRKAHWDETQKKAIEASLEQRENIILPPMSGSPINQEDFVQRRRIFWPIDKTMFSSREAIEKLPKKALENSTENTQKSDSQASIKLIATFKRKLEKLKHNQQLSIRDEKQRMYQLKCLPCFKVLPKSLKITSSKKQLVTVNRLPSLEKSARSLVGHGLASRGAVTERKKGIAESSVNLLPCRAMEGQKEPSFFKPDEEQLVKILEIKNHQARPLFSRPLIMNDKRKRFYSNRRVKDNVDVELSHQIETEILHDFKQLFNDSN